MHPVGPEPSETYWLRRALLVGAFLVLVIIVLLFVFNLRSPTGQAAPSESSSAVETSDPQTGGEASARTTPSATAKASATSSPTAKETAESPAPTDKTDKTDKTSETDKTDETAKTDTDKPEKSDRTDEGKKDSEKSDKAKDEPTGKTSDKEKKDEGGDSSSKKAEPETKKPVKACDPDDLRPTLTGDSHTAKAGKSVGFELKLINGGGAPCHLEVGGDNYELKIYSGTDRIWSSNDCRKTEPSIDQVVAPEKSVLWTMEWNGKRSRKDAECKNRPETPRPGYYYATSQYRGADPVQFLVVVR